MSQQQREYALADILARAIIFIDKLGTWEEFKESLPIPLKGIANHFYSYKDQLIKEV